MIGSFQTFFAAAGDACQFVNNSFLGLPHWYQYLKGEDDGAGTCTPVIHKLNDFWPVILAIGEILIRVAGIVAVFYVIIAGFNYVTSTGESDKTARARQKIINALAGLVITTIAAGFVQFVGDHIASSGTTSAGLIKAPANTNAISSLLNILFTSIGALSFLMIVIAGFLYVTSQGDPSRTARARNTIVYSAVGLVVAVLATAITNYVLKA